MVPDERSTRRHGGASEEMVRMTVRRDHVANRFGGEAAHSGDKVLPDADAASSIHDGNSVVTDDDAQVGGIARILGGCQCNLAKMHIVTIRDLLNTKRACLRVPQWED